MRSQSVNVTPTSVSNVCLRLILRPDKHFGHFLLVVNCVQRHKEIAMAVINAAGRYGLAEYFRIEIEKISNPRASADTSCYLSSMLERFARSEIYFSADQDGIGLRPLALIY